MSQSSESELLFYFRSSDSESIVIYIERPFAKNTNIKK